MAHFPRALVLALLSASGLSSQTMAQSNVVVYGNLDVSLTKVSGEEILLDRGYNNWLGFKGQEDLGDGLSAIFNIQMRFKPDTGEQERPRTFWQGESTVGLKHASLGTLRLGRALSPLWQTVWAYEPWQNSGFNASLAAYQTGSYTSDGVNDVALGFANFSRISNGIFYTSPEISGLTVHLASEVEKSEGPGGTAPGRVRGTSLNYARGPLATMLSYERNGREDDIYFVGAAYQFGSATLMGSYARTERVAAPREKTFVLAGTYALGADTIRGGYGRNQETDAYKLSTGYVHALSKRTNLYADLWREKTPDSRNGFALGVNHTF